MAVILSFIVTAWRYVSVTNKLSVYVCVVACVRAYMLVCELESDVLRP